MSELDLSLLDLFREEVVSHTATLTTGLVELESDPANPQRIEPLMRAAHSIKGAARIVGIEAAVDLAHVLEDALVAAQHGRIRLTPADIDVLLRGSDLLGGLGQLDAATMKTWGATHAAALASLGDILVAMTRGQPANLNSSQFSVRSSQVPAAVNSPQEPIPDSSRLRDLSCQDAETVIIPREPIVPGDEHPMYDLFREELRQQSLALTQGLQRLEQQPGATDVVHRLLESARAIRAAARIVGLDTPAEVAGRMEGLLSALERGDTTGAAGRLPVMREGVYLLAGLIEQPAESAGDWVKQQQPALQTILARLEDVALVPAAAPASAPPAPLPRGPLVPAKAEPAALPPPAAEVEVEIGEGQAPLPESAEAVVRVTAQSLNRLMSLAGESLVQARWLQPFATALLKLKKKQDHLATLLDTLGAALAENSRDEGIESLLTEIHTQSAACRQVLADRMGEFEDHAARAEDLNSRLYREVIVSRMRPFSDGARGLPRMVRDMARTLGKQVRLEIQGQSTEVDRDILERLEAPLMHLVRNAVDHGIEPPPRRLAAGKPEQGVIRLDVRHRAGTLAITVSDDGSGIDLDQLRRKIVDRGLSSGDMVAGMNEAELLEFLFLPGFTTTKAVTEYSGRGVGLDVVQDTIRKVGGAVRLSTALGRGTSFHLQLPITLSVLRAVVVEIAGEPYAFSHNRIDRLLRVPLDSISSVEHRQFVNVDGHNVGLVLAAQLLDLPSSPSTDPDLPVLLLSDETGQYGLIVEAFRGEQDLVVRPLDPRLGKVPNISAAALLDDGTPVLIADIEDLIRSMDHYIQSGSLRRCLVINREEKRRKRVLVVDDSITVREVERQLLRNAGYDVDVAVDGKDGWNQVRSGGYDLLVTDIDMPRMTGLELVKAVRDLDGIKALPVVVVSYKDREEDRLRGMEAGANFYLTKSSFHDNTFLRAVADLIGEAWNVRVAIVNDLLLAREALRRVVLSEPGHSIAWMAEDGAEAVRRARQDRPDVILMDLLMPVLDGVEATRQIMASAPCPILLVTASVDGNFPLVLQAMGHGGLDAVNTPVLGCDGRVSGGQQLLSRLARLGRATTSPFGASSGPGAGAVQLRGSSHLHGPPLLVIGASTGGPEAVARVLGGLPAGFAAAVVVIQHIGAEFASNLVLWLSRRCQLSVEVAREGGTPRAGVVSVAATDDHLIVQPNLRFHYTREPADYPYRPSVNRFCDSLAAYWSTPGVAVLLTGMGDDGGRGLARLRQAGWLTLAQDQQSSVVYSMPRAAIELNGACRVLSPEQMAPVIVSRLTSA